VGSGGSAWLTFKVWADNSAGSTGKITFDVVADQGT
jgi:hypothetical protein